MQSAKGNSPIKQNFYSWDFTGSTCRIRNTHLTFVSESGLPSVLCHCKSNNSVHDHLAASFEDHERNILPEDCFPIPAWGDCRMLSLPPASVHGALVIEFPTCQISSCREENPLVSSHKRGKSSLSNNKKNFSSKPTNLTNVNLGAFDMRQSKSPVSGFLRLILTSFFQKFPGAAHKASNE